FSYLDLDGASVDGQVLQGVGRMRHRTLLRMRREAELVKLDAPGTAEREERPGYERPILIREPARLRRAKQRRTAGRLAADERRERHVEGARNLPQRLDGGRALAKLDLAEHRPA